MRLSNPILRGPQAFVAATLGLSWAFVAFIFSSRERVALFPFIMFIPACVGIVVSSWQHRSLAHLLRPIMRSPRLSVTAFSVAFPVVVIAACAALAAVMGVATLNHDRIDTLFVLPSLGGFLMAMLAMFGEEYGWRGYLLDELVRAYRPVVAALLVGGIWALWHAPLLFGLAVFMGTGQPALVTVIQMAAVVVFSFPFAFAYLRSGSVIPPMLFHYMWNTFNPRVLGNIYQNKPGLMHGNILIINGEAILGIAVGAAFIWWFWRRDTRGAFDAGLRRLGLRRDPEMANAA
jgi:uncharacterized protein